MEGTPVRHIQEVYAVVLGVGLVLAVEQVINPEAEGVLVHAELLPGFLAFVSLAFSTYHWAVTYLDNRYKVAPQARDAPKVYVDLAIGTTELLLLIGLAVLISQPVTLAGGMIVLLGFEVGAGIVLSLVGSYANFERFPRDYLILNLTTVTVLAAGIGVTSLLSVELTGGAVGLGLLVATGARTVVFYRKGFATIFGEQAA